MTTVVTQYYTSTSFKQKEGYQGAKLFTPKSEYPLFAQKKSTSVEPSIISSITEVEPRGW